MLELYQFEECPHCRKVRQQLSDWEIDYILRNAPRDLEKRTQLMKVSGQAKVPTLVDSDRERILAGSEEEILSYLIEFYKPPEPVDEPSFPSDATGKGADFKGYA